MKTILIDAVDTFVIEGEGVFKEMYDLLEKFPNRKIILTNANDEQILKFGLVDLPYELFTLKHNPDKTDAAYFETMLKHFKLAADDAVYFEHNPDAVESAQLVGINSYYYDPNAKNLKALEQFLKQNL